MFLSLTNSDAGTSNILLACFNEFTLIVNLFVVGITSDNEYGIVAGIKQTFDTYPHLIKISCGLHTIECFLNDLGKHYAPLDHALDVAKDFCIHVRNHKNELKALKSYQQPEKGLLFSFVPLLFLFLTLQQRSTPIDPPSVE